MYIIRLLLIVFFLQSCANVTVRDYFLKPNSSNPASIEVIRKILYIEKYILNKPKEIGGVYYKHIDDIECLSGFGFKPVGNWAGDIIPDSITVEKWKQWYLKNSNNFRYARVNEFSKDSIEYFRESNKGKSIEVYFEKIIVLENKKDSLYSYTKCDNTVN